MLITSEEVDKFFNSDDLIIEVEAGEKVDNPLLEYYYQLPNIGKLIKG